MITEFSLNNVQLIWVVIFVIILYDVKDRLLQRSEKEWEKDFTIQHGFLQRRSSATAKLFSTLTSKNMIELSESVAIEMCRDAGIYFNKTIFFFLSMRQEPQELMEYFTNDELVLFLFKPDVWVSNYILKYRGGLSFLGRDKKKIDERFIEELDRLLEIFRKELVDKKYKFIAT